MKSGSDPTRCQNKDENLPSFVSKQQCFEDENHEGAHRYTMNKEELDEFFSILDSITVDNNGQVQRG